MYNHLPTLLIFKTALQTNSEYILLQLSPHTGISLSSLELLQYCGVPTVAEEFRENVPGVHPEGIKY